MFWSLQIVIKTTTQNMWINFICGIFVGNFNMTCHKNSVRKFLCDHQWAVNSDMARPKFKINICCNVACWKSRTRTVALVLPWKGYEWKMFSTAKSTGAVYRGSGLMVRTKGATPGVLVTKTRVERRSILSRPNDGTIETRTVLPFPAVRYRLRGHTSEGMSEWRGGCETKG